MKGRTEGQKKKEKRRKIPYLFSIGVHYQKFANVPPSIQGNGFIHIEGALLLGIKLAGGARSRKFSR
jgi:hypothetical protein